MEIKNLRIGNLLTWKDQEEVSTEAILTYVGGVLNDCIWLEWVWADGEADNTDCDLDSVKGIEITDDWLIDFGFKKDNNGNYWIDLQTHYLELMLSNGHWYPTYAQVPEMSHEDEQRISINRIEFVHELQNLFFALTGTELELKQERSTCS